MSISVTAKEQPTLRDIVFVMSFTIEGEEVVEAKAMPTLTGRQRRKYQERYMK